MSPAYEVLSDPEKRQVYDHYGEEGLKAHSQQEQAQQQQGGFNVFNQFFGGGFGGFGQQQEPQKPRGHDVLLEFPVTLEDLYTGKKHNILRDKIELVEMKGKNTRDCNCRQQLVQKRVGPNMIQQFTQEVCDKCPELKRKRVTETIQIAVEAGERDGEEFVFYDEGEPVEDGDRGDLRIVLREEQHKIFARRGQDLHMDYTISLEEALTGFKHEVAHLDGHTFLIENTDKYVISHAHASTLLRYTLSLSLSLFSCTPWRRLMTISVRLCAYSPCRVSVSSPHSYQGHRAA